MIRYYLIFFFLMACGTKELRKDWVYSESKEGGFSLAYPNFPVKRSKISQIKEHYGKISINRYEITTDEKNDKNLKYAFEWVLYNEESEELGIYVFTRDIRNANERLIRQKAKELNGIVDSLFHFNKKGIEVCETKISLKGKSLHLYIQTFIKGNKQYTMEVLTKNGNLKDSSTLKFFSSFHFTPQKPKVVTGLQLKCKEEPKFYKNGERYHAKVFFGKSTLYDSLKVKPIIRFKNGEYTKYEDYNHLITTVGDTGYVNFIVKDESVKAGEEKIKKWSVYVTLPLPKRDTSFVLTNSYIVTK